VGANAVPYEPAVKRGFSVSAVLLLALMSACGQQAAKPTITHSSASASASESAAANASLDSSPTASTSTAPASTPQGMTCKIPVVTDNDAGWVTFPGGSYQVDPKANTSLPHGSSFPLSKSYAKAVERWVPAPRDDLSPDGTHYAYADLPPVNNSPVHVVDLPSGTNHAFNPGTPPPDSSWVAVDYETEGVYLETQPNGPAGMVGLWLLNPSNGAVKQIDATHSWQYISGGGAWGTSEPLTGHGPGPGSRLMRMDLKTGAIASWFKRTDVEFTVAGADGAGHPVLQVTKNSAPQLLLITAANSATILQPAPGSAVPSLSNIVHPVTDSHGIWFGDTAGSLSLYTPATGIKKMAQVGSGDVTAGGGCR
jgi:hypothetical protein